MKNKDVLDFINFTSNQMEAERLHLTELDAQTGDGDMGVTIALIFRTLKKCVKNDEEDVDLKALILKFSEQIEEYAPSTFGTLVSTMLKSISDDITNQDAITPGFFSDMLCWAAEGVMNRGGAKAGDKTLLDALIPAGEAAKTESEKGSDLFTTINAAASAASKGAAQTEQMQAKIGRAGYMGERTIGNRDPGAEAIAQFLTSVCDYIKHQ